MIKKDTFLQRRQRLLLSMLPSSAALIFASQKIMYSANNEYPFHQNSNFWYFTGFNEPDALLVLIKINKMRNYSILFNRMKNKHDEIWFGYRLGQKEAPEKLGVDYAFPWEILEEQLYQFLNGLIAVYHAQGEYNFADKILFTALDKLRFGFKKNLKVPNTIIDWRPIVYRMRLFKESDEQEILRQAGKISAMAHTRAMQVCHPGMFEFQLAGEIHYGFTNYGAQDSSYNTIVGGGNNACILHYTENRNKLQNGDLVLVDAGCKFHGYAVDITRTFPVNGKFSKPQRAIYNIVLSSINKALSMFRPDISIREINEAVIYIMIKGLLDLKIIQGDIKKLIANNIHRQFFMHELSHWIGLDVHDIGNYGMLNLDCVLKPGMALSIEPGLYIDENSNVPPEYRGIGIRIEDNVLINEIGNENLTNGVVKEIGDIEVTMAAK